MCQQGNIDLKFKMKPLGFWKHLFCYVTLGLLSGWYYFLMLLVPILIVASFYKSYIAMFILTILFVLTVLPLDHRPRREFMSSWIFKWWTEYFDMTVDNESISNGKMDPNKQYMFLEFPHGIFPMGSFLAVYFMDLIAPGGMVCGIGADAIFTFPIMRQMMAWIGTQPAKRSNITKILKQGYHCAVIPGGIAEMFLVNSTTESIFFKKRQNTIKAAIQEGTDIIPLFFFGNSRLFHIAGQNGSDSFLSRLSRKLKASIVFFYGRHYLPVPLRHPIHLVSGDIVKVTQKDFPTEDDIKAVQQQVIDVLHKVYTEKKPIWETRPLIIN